VKSFLLLKNSAKQLVFYAFLSIALTLNCTLAMAEDYTNLKITEISYHPKDVINGIDTTDGSDLEFIEFKNIGDLSINLTGLIVDSAVYYEFPNDIQLGPKQFWVIASKPSKFLEYYKMEPSGNFSGNLANSGEEILIRTTDGTTVIDFVYDDHAPWPEDPDGNGYTLVSTFFNPTGNPGDESYWRASLKLYGSPFNDDNVSGISENSDLSNILEIYPNPASESLTININDANSTSAIYAGIYDVSGSLVYQVNNSGKTTIDLKQVGIKAGIYLFRLECNKNVITKRLIVI
jgi:hypothetical protein